MFGAKNDSLTAAYDGKSASKQGATVIARGVKVEGDFHSPGDVVIEGDVEGKITIDGVLTIGPESNVKADVKANDASVAGHLEGNVAVKKRLELKSTASIIGDVTCEVVAIESGARLHGRVAVGAPLDAPLPFVSSSKAECHRPAASEA